MPKQSTYLNSLRAQNYVKITDFTEQLKEILDREAALKAFLKAYFVDYSISSIYKNGREGLLWQEYMASMNPILYIAFLEDGLRLRGFVLIFRTKLESSLKHLFYLSTIKNKFYTKQQ